MIIKSTSDFYGLLNSSSWDSQGRTTSFQGRHENFIDLESSIEIEMNQNIKFKWIIL